ncbi:MAG: response regulator transcription factor [Armatimonadota bacterium]|nr:response regulator transcription factor [Armatimonadota bacterium]
MIRILITDDHAIVRRGLKDILADEFPGANFGEAQNAVELLRQLRQQTWDIVILDITMPGRSGLDVLKDVKHEHPKLPVLVLTVHPEDQYAVRVLKAGANGFMNKESAPEELVKAVNRLLQGGRYVSPSLAEKLAFDLRAETMEAPHEKLSDREYQVLCMIASGKTVSQIAEDLSLSVKTISTHRVRLLAKMNMKTNAELTRYAIQNRLVG